MRLGTRTDTFVNNRNIFSNLSSLVAQTLGVRAGIFLGSRGVFHLQKNSEYFYWEFWEFPFGKRAFHLSQVPFVYKPLSVASPKNRCLGKLGRFPFDQKFRKFRFGAKWKTFFRFTRLEHSQKKCSEGSPVFPVGTSQWKFVFRFLVFITSSMPFAVF